MGEEISDRSKRMLRMGVDKLKEYAEGGVRFKAPSEYKTPTGAGTPGFPPLHG